MKNSYLLSIVAAFAFFCLENAQGATKTYQVTGPVIELTDKIIVVQKGDERWEIARDESSKIKGVVKVGEKVTVYYRMTAVTIESKLANGELPSSEKAKTKKATK